MTLPGETWPDLASERARIWSNTERLCGPGLRTHLGRGNFYLSFLFILAPSFTYQAILKYWIHLNTLFRFTGSSSGFPLCGFVSFSLEEDVDKKVVINHSSILVQYLNPLFDRCSNLIVRNYTHALYVSPWTNHFTKYHDFDLWVQGVQQIEL